ncbi:GGDEF domain-containing protein [Krasilnikovia cinnamomea]|uniref:GGDEF domain-containing protein n=1 Tax=Krasilnikovia cinnamomea TaxID=349313 RepID=UPI001F5E5AA6|nr:GGDEF domain-containing protein [Krasilnikovia cinnamomea]
MHGATTDPVLLHIQGAFRVLQTWQDLAIIALIATLIVAVVVIAWQQKSLIQARYLANHDVTTGLPNRRAVTACLRTALRKGRATGLVMVDLDRFKSINDTYGHEHGNDVLAEVGRRLAGITAPAALAARLSGDEFVLLVDGGYDQTAAVAHAASRIIARTAVRVGGREVRVSASVGFATATLGISGRELLRAADIAMYQAKRYGRATVYGMPPSTEQPGIGRGPRYRDLRRDTGDGYPATPLPTNEEYPSHG